MHQKRRGSASLLAWAVLFLAPAVQAETSAGQRITNTASLSARQDDRPIDTRSNTAELIIGERLDVALVPIANDGGPVALLLTNGGNGQEAFTLVASVANSSVSVRGIAIDRDGDGRYDPTVDLLVGNATPALAPGATLRLLVLLDSREPASTPLTVTATSVTASGTPGTIAAAAGDGGGDAVVGPTGAQARVTLDAAAPSPGDTGGGAAGGASLTKSQAVRAPDGSATAVRDAIITYTLVARFAAAATAARIDDPVPAGTAYVAGSLTLDGAPLTDAADGDAGSGDSRAIAVALGDPAAATVRTVQFQVKIQ